MKRTNNMVYVNSVESQELLLFTANSQKYQYCIASIIKNLHRKYVKGIFDEDKAIDIFYPLCCQASKDYNRLFGYYFTVTERFSAATDLVDYFEEEIINGLME